MKRLLIVLSMLALLAGALAPPVQAEFINGDLTVAGYINYCAASGGSNAYACALPATITQYRTGGCYSFLANATNTGAATLNLNGIGPKPITKFAGGLAGPLAAGDIGTNQVVSVCYDGATMQVQSGVTTATSGTGGTVTSVSGSGPMTGGPITTAGTFGFDSSLPFFLKDGGTTTLTCGPGAQGKAQVMDNGEFQYCDGAGVAIVRRGTLTQTGLTWNVTPSACSLDGSGGKLTVNASNQIICAPDAGATGGSFAELTGGVNTTATMTCGTGCSVIPVDDGEIRATSLPGTGLTSPVPDEMIPDLNVLSTGLIPNRCLGTDASNHLVSSTAACNTGGVGGTGAWGGIDGVIADQLDLQAALDAKVPITRAVNGHPLTSDIAVTAADLGLGAVDNTNDAQKNSATVTLTNHAVAPRVQLLTILTGTPNHITPNLNDTDVGYQHALTTPITMDNPTFTAPNPRDQQLIAFEFRSATPQAITWSSMYSNECGLALPQGTTGDNGANAVYNRFLFRYSPVSTKLCLIASTKSDDVRVTTVAPSATYNCPVDNSDLCEMSHNLAAGTVAIDVFPRGAPSNGQRLSIAIRCTALQTLTWDTIFIDSPTFSRPTSCAADNTKWLSIDARYSTVLVKWQVTRGSVGAAYTLPSTVVQTNQANTYGAFAQNFAAATSLTLPTSPGAAPTAMGTMAYDSTQEIPKFGENGMLSSSPARLIYISDAGNSNNGQTGDFLHTGATITIPANYLVAHRALRLCTMWRFTTAGSPGTLALKYRIVSPALDLANVSVSTPGSGTNVTTALCMLVVVKDAPGATANVYTAPINQPSSSFTTGVYSGTVQPIALPTNASLTLTMISRWNTPVAGNIVTPDLFLVEALN